MFFLKWRMIPELNGSSALPIKVKSKQLDYYFVVVQVMHVYIHLCRYQFSEDNNEVRPIVM